MVEQLDVDVVDAESGLGAEAFEAYGQGGGVKAAHQHQPEPVGVGAQLRGHVGADAVEAGGAHLLQLSF